MVVLALGAGLVIFLAMAPVRGCVQRSEPGPDPARFWMECRTLSGRTVTIDNTTGSGEWHMARHVDPAYGPSVAFAAIAAGIVLMIGAIGRSLDDPHL